MKHTFATIFLSLFATVTTFAQISTPVVVDDARNPSIGIQIKPAKPSKKYVERHDLEKAALGFASLIDEFYGGTQGLITRMQNEHRTSFHGFFKVNGALADISKIGKGCSSYNVEGTVFPAFFPYSITVNTEGKVRATIGLILLPLVITSLLGGAERLATEPIVSRFQA